jgi:cation transport ATPase
MFLPFTGTWYMSMNKFPSEFGPLSISTIFNLLLTVYVLCIYAKPFIVRSYYNYRESGSMDMETLISLGCMSGFFLFCFFFVRYSIEFINGSLISGHEIMEMNYALASSAIIVLVVTIGKYFERKAKDKIQKMT